MTINIGDDVFILAGAGSISEGVFTGEQSEGMFGVTLPFNKVYFKNMKDIFKDEETAKARWFIKRFKRLAAQGYPIDEIVSEDLDKRSIEIATKLWPEDMV